MERIIEELQKLGPLDQGEERVLVFDDAVVIANVADAEELKLKIVVGYHRIEGGLFLERGLE